MITSLKEDLLKGRNIWTYCYIDGILYVMNEQWNTIALLLSQNRPTFEALGDKHRQEIIMILAVAQRSVGELAVEMGLSRPAVSHHIKVLKDAGLLSETKKGVRRYYQPVFTSSAESMTVLLQEIEKVS